MDRLMRPISRKASASPFWRGNADSFASKVEGRTLAGTDRGNETQDVIPVRLDRSTLTDSPMSEARFSGGVSPGRDGAVILKAAQPGHELETDKMTKSETHVADPAGVDANGFRWRDRAAMIQQTVENVDGLARIGVHGDDGTRHTGRR